MPASHDDFAHLHEEPRMPTPHASSDTSPKTLVKKYRKAIVGVLTPVVTTVAAKYGLGLTTAEAGSIAGVLTGVLVAIVPNSYGKSIRRAPSSPREKES